MMAGSRPDVIGRRIAGVVAGTGLLALTATGLWLLFFYQPASVAAWTDVGSLGDGRGAWYWMQLVHRLLTPVTLVAVAAWLSLGFLARRPFRPAAAGRVGVAGSLALAGAITAGLTGLWLPWDQLALGAVTVGTDITGYTRILQADDVRFVLVDGRRISLSTMRRLLVLHVVAGAGSAVLLAAGTWFDRRTGRAGASDPA